MKREEGPGHRDLVVETRNLVVETSDEGEL